MFSKEVAPNHFEQGKSLPRAQYFTPGQRDHNLKHAEISLILSKGSSPLLSVPGSTAISLLCFMPNSPKMLCILVSNPSRAFPQGSIPSTPAAELLPRSEWPLTLEMLPQSLSFLKHLLHVASGTPLCTPSGSPSVLLVSSS